MTSDVGGNHLPESLSGPCRLLRYHELNTHKVTKLDELMKMPSSSTRTENSVVTCSGPVRELRERGGNTHPIRV